MKNLEKRLKHEKYEGPLRKFDGVWYKMIYRKSKEGSIELLGEIPNFYKREWDQEHKLYINYFRIDV